MGKLKEGLNGPISGKVGNNVYYTMYGETRVRMKPSKRTGKKTEKEKANTGKFAKVQAFLKPLKVFLREGFKNYGSKTGGYKAAVSYALHNAIAGEGVDQYVDPALVRVSGGELHFPSSAEAYLEPDLKLRFNWDNHASEFERNYDQAMLLAYNIEENNVIDNTTGAFRADGTDFLQLYAEPVALEFHVYLGFVARDRSQQSHSVYLGMVTVPASS